jgi:hypothetical protein
MRRLAFIIATIIALAGCSKSNPLVGTKWVAVEANPNAFDVYSYTLEFNSETEGTMTYDDFIHEKEATTFSYTYIEPNVVITLNGNSISGVLNKNEITFKEMSIDGQDLIFNKTKK